MLVVNTCCLRGKCDKAEAGDFSSKQRDYGIEACLTKYCSNMETKKFGLEEKKRIKS